MSSFIGIPKESIFRNGVSAFTSRCCCGHSGARAPGAAGKRCRGGKPDFRMRTTTMLEPIDSMMHKSFGCPIVLKVEPLPFREIDWFNPNPYSFQHCNQTQRKEYFEKLARKGYSLGHLNSLGWRRVLSCRQSLMKLPVRLRYWLFRVDGIVTIAMDSYLKYKRGTTLKLGSLEPEPSDSLLYDRP